MSSLLNGFICISCPFTPGYTFDTIQNEDVTNDIETVATLDFARELNRYVEDELMNVQPIYQFVFNSKNLKSIESIIKRATQKNEDLIVFFAFSDGLANAFIEAYAQNSRIVSMAEKNKENSLFVHNLGFVDNPKFWGDSAMAQVAKLFVYNAYDSCGYIPSEV